MPPDPLTPRAFGTRKFLPTPVKADEDDELTDSTNVLIAQYSKSSKPRFSSYFKNFGLDDRFLLGEIINISAVWCRISSFESNGTH